MKKLIMLVLILVSCTSKKENPNADFTTVFEKTNGTETATYEQTIQYYIDLEQAYPQISMEAIGQTDSGMPLHIITLNPDGNFGFQSIRKDKRILLINNGIHPGESDGIDAVMMLFRDIVQGKIETPEKTVLVTIPIYNVGGSLNRNSTTRTNQNGPKEYGFRGNARNYDLNRDFIKADTKNSRTFAEIFHLVKPDVFIDNHVSNGADYQYTLTHLFTQHNKLGGELGNYLHTEMMPGLEASLSQKNWDITPYVNVFNRVPEKGFSQFMDYPRYSTGYTTLFNTLGMMVETHMLKPYKQRVEGTYELMRSMIKIVDEDSEKIKALRQNAKASNQKLKSYPLDWTIDTTRSSTIDFKGYDGSMIPSEITGAQRLKFDRNKPFIKEVNYRNHFVPKIEVSVPQAYIIPKGWHNVVELLELNNVEMTRFENDTTLTIEAYRIKDYKTRTNPYEGHYPHYNTQIETKIMEMTFKEGDLLIKTGQSAFRYLLETLEPQAPDSFFNWNFFDTILQQKEGFSPYVWEDKAKVLMRADPKMHINFNLKKTYDKEFAENWYAQLDYIHKHSGYYEKAHLQYPIYRIP
ncbi:MAG: M14 family metallopeptidase [Flavobacteriaceae bacterium]|nr:M14 family metallopeptidase [Flavobacteriaceae bacterium]